MLTLVTNHIMHHCICVTFFFPGSIWCSERAVSIVHRITVPSTAIRRYCSTASPWKANQAKYKSPHLERVCQVDTFSSQLRFKVLLLCTSIGLPRLAQQLYICCRNVLQLVLQNGFAFDTFYCCLVDHFHELYASCHYWKQELDEESKMPQSMWQL